MYAKPRKMLKKLQMWKVGIGTPISEKSAKMKTRLHYGRWWSSDAVVGQSSDESSVSSESSISGFLPPSSLSAIPPSPAYSLRRRATVASLPFDVDKASPTVQQWIRRAVHTSTFFFFFSICVPLEGWGLGAGDTETLSDLSGVESNCHELTVCFSNNPPVAAEKPMLTNSGKKSLRSTS
nr:hypothetical protein Iba_chr06bCG0220 [Ipomoea batatas]